MEKHNPGELLKLAGLTASRAAKRLGWRRSTLGNKLAPRSAEWHRPWSANEAMDYYQLCLDNCPTGSLDDFPAFLDVEWG